MNKNKIFSSIKIKKFLYNKWIKHKSNKFRLKIILIKKFVFKKKIIRLKAKLVKIHKSKLIRGVIQYQCLKISKKIKIYNKVKKLQKINCKIIINQTLKISQKP